MNKALNIAAAGVAVVALTACPPPQTSSGWHGGDGITRIACDETRIPGNERTWCMDWTRGDGTKVHGPYWHWEHEVKYDLGIQPPAPTPAP